MYIYTDVCPEKQVGARGQISVYVCKCLMYVVETMGSNVLCMYMGTYIHA
jgi:hypothetical protein